jgi:uncharacterized protein (TIGR03435 family)
MNLYSLSETSSGVVLAVGNHLWQSTIFACVGGVLALALRKNAAKTRYGIWVIVSAKFLVPFSLLVGIGAHLRWSHLPAISSASTPIALEQATTAFAYPLGVEPPVAIETGVVERSADLLPRMRFQRWSPIALAAIWVIGFIWVFLHWSIRWRRVFTLFRHGQCLGEGRELDALRRLERNLIGGIRYPLRIVASSHSIEPGVFGIFRPVLMWPQGLSDRLDDAHLETILTHEIWHVRRGDNLTGAMHMVVEAIFWFYPLVWWLRRRLSEERERACDEEVLRLPNSPDVYAESILKVCEFCVQSPLPCVSGVTSSDLKRRITYIMTEQIGLRLNLAEKSVLTAAGLLAVALPVVAGAIGVPLSLSKIPITSGSSIPSGNAAVSTNDTRRNIAPAVEAEHPRRSAIAPQIESAFTPINSFQGDISSDLDRATKDTASEIPQPLPLKPMAAEADPTLNVIMLKRSDPSAPNGNILATGGGRNFSAHNNSLASLIEFAYDVHLKQIVNGPEWIDEERFDIAAVPDLDGLPSYSQWLSMIQKLLGSRFGLTLHRERRQLSVYALTVGKDGPKSLTEDSSAAALPALSFKRVSGAVVLSAKDATTGDLAKVLQQIVLDRPVVDQTGLARRYDFTLTWAPGDDRSGHLSPASDDPNAPPSPLDAVREQLNLRLDPVEIPADVLVIDHAEQPSEN